MKPSAPAARRPGAEIRPFRGSRRWHPACSLAGHRGRVERRDRQHRPARDEAPRPRQEARMASRHARAPVRGRENSRSPRRPGAVRSARAGRAASVRGAARASGNSTGAAGEDRPRPEAGLRTGSRSDAPAGTPACRPRGWRRCGRRRQPTKTMAVPAAVADRREWRPFGRHRDGCACANVVRPGRAGVVVAGDAGPFLRTASRHPARAPSLSV